MKRLLLILLLLCGCAGATKRPSESYIAVEKSEQSDPAEKKVHVHLDTGKHRMTAYQILLHFDPSIARIESIDRCDHQTFPSEPEFDTASFRRGLTRILASRSEGAPAGELHLLTITFQKNGSGSSPVDVVVEALYDDTNPPKKFSGTLSVWPQRVTFE